MIIDLHLKTLRLLPMTLKVCYMSIEIILFGSNDLSNRLSKMQPSNLLVKENKILMELVKISLMIGSNPCTFPVPYKLRKYISSYMGRGRKCPLRIFALSTSCWSSAIFGYKMNSNFGDLFFDDFLGPLANFRFCPYPPTIFSKICTPLPMYA
jgi:hypothetical protein